MKLRSIVFWLHLLCGVTAGIVVLMMSVTGGLLMYQRQIQTWADTRHYRNSVPQGADRQTISQIIDRVRDAKPDWRPSTVMFNADASMPVAVAAGQGQTVYIDPYTGRVLGEGEGQGARAFFRSVTDWHRWFAASAENRSIGRGVTGASNLVFLFIVTSGFYLWWPSSWSWRAVRNVTWFRRHLPGKARDFNWHNTIGFWSAIPLWVIVASGVVMSYPWANNLIYRMAGEAPPVAGRPPEGGQAGGRAGAPVQRRGGPDEGRSGGGPAGQRVEGGSRERANVQLDALFTKVERERTGWQTIAVRIPNGSAPVTFTLDSGTGGQPAKRSTLVLDPRTGAVVRSESFADMTPGRRARSWLRFAHTGEVYGVVGQTIAGAVSFGGAVLVWTGLALSYRRFAAWNKRRVPAAALRREPDQVTTAGRVRV